MTAILWTAKSSNVKTGPIPVSTTESSTCSPSCPLAIDKSCYAMNGGISWMWKKLDNAGANATFKSGVATLTSIDWSGLVANVAALPVNQLWRHNQAGDLPHTDGTIDADAVAELAEANSGKRGFTYTHHDVELNEFNRAAVRDAVANGFTINLSANNRAHADRLADLAIAPVVSMMPIKYQRTSNGKAGKAFEWTETLADYRARISEYEQTTPDGRKVVVCPATYRDDVNCKSCGLCQKQRDVIVGFPAHGSRKGRIAA
jgi:hypothetical protein